MPALEVKPQHGNIIFMPACLALNIFCQNACQMHAKKTFHNLSNPSVYSVNLRLSAVTDSDDPVCLLHLEHQCMQRIFAFGSRLLAYNEARNGLRGRTNIVVVADVLNLGTMPVCVKPPSCGCSLLFDCKWKAMKLDRMKWVRSKRVAYSRVGGAYSRFDRGVAKLPGATRVGSLHSRFKRKCSLV